MNFLTDLFNKIDEQKRKKTDKESGKGDVGSVAMETKTKLVEQRYKLANGLVKLEDTNETVMKNIETKSICDDDT